MKTPFVLDNEGDILIADTLERVSGHVEPDHVEAGEYVAYAADGERLEFGSTVERVVGLFGRRRDRLVVTLRPTGEDASSELREKLVRLLGRFGHDKRSLAALPMTELIDRVASAVGRI